MSNAAEQARSTRSDARAFADAFAEADDAFTFGSSAGESRTLTLSELGSVLDLDAPVAIPPARRFAPAPQEDEPLDDASEGDGELLTLAELGDALARPPVEADVLDFDFGSGTAERARRRTAARSAPSGHRQRRVSGPASGRNVVDSAESDDISAVLPRPGRAASTSTGPQPLVVPQGKRAGKSRATGPAKHRLRPVAEDVAVTRRPLPGSGVVQRFRADPDRIALYAVLLGILLVLIAASSSSSGVSLLTLQLL